MQDRFAGFMGEGCAAHGIYDLFAPEHARASQVLEDDVGAIDRVHARQGVPAENGVTLPPPPAEFLRGHVEGQVVHAAEDGTGRLADLHRPGRIDEDRLDRSGRLHRHLPVAGRGHRRDRRHAGCAGRAG